MMVCQLVGPKNNVQILYLEYFLAGFRIRIELMQIRIRIRIQHFSNYGSGFWIRIPDQVSGSGFRIRFPNPDSGSGFRIQIPDPDPGFDDLKLKNIYSWKFNFIF
jgi:hypothetical protein